MNITKEYNILLLQVLQPANFGSASGNMTIDSPTQKEAFSNLPFIPDSSLKGVLRDTFNSDINLTKQVFGSSDVDSEEEKKSNGAGKLILGNGDLLAFPLLSLDEVPCYIFPISNLLKLLKLWAIINNEEINIPSISYPLDKDTKKVILFNEEKMPDVGIDLEPLRDSDLNEEMILLKKIILNITSNLFIVNKALIVVSEESGDKLWSQAAEIRTVTALTESRSAKAQSLRRIELVPEGSLFFSFVSWLGDSSIDLPDYPIQVGGFEGIGLGLLHIQLLEKMDLSIDASLDNVFDVSEATRPELVIKKAYERVYALGNSSIDLRKNIKTIVRSFASKVMQTNFESALGFEFAKVKIAKENRSSESDAHKWFLQTLLDRDISIEHLQDFFNSPISAKDRADWLLKIYYLRKYVEILL